MPSILERTGGAMAALSIALAAAGCHEPHSMPLMRLVLENESEHSAAGTQAAFALEQLDLYFGNKLHEEHEAVAGQQRAAEADVASY